MTERAEIELLLQMTGRTLEGLPEEHGMAERIDAMHRPGEWCEIVCHQSDVIELLVGALRDALDKRDAALAKVPRWISVKERLPRCGERVLVCNGGSVWEAYLSISHKWVRYEFLWAIDVTHWMPLPEPPKEGE